MVNQESGAVIETLQTTGYQMKMHFEIHNDPGCDEQSMAVIPVRDHNQIETRATTTEKIRISMRS